MEGNERINRVDMVLIWGELYYLHQSQDEVYVPFQHVVAPDIM